MHIIGIVKKYVIEEYTTENGDAPFSEWIDGLKDSIAQLKVSQRIDRAMLGNFGDYKSIKGSKGLLEMRINYGPGYRVFYSITQGKIVLLLAGSIKRDQDKAIQKAAQYLADYERRNRHD